MEKRGFREKDKELLEYNKFLELLSEYTPNEKTKELVKNLNIETNPERINKKTTLAKEFIQIVEKEGYFPLTEYPDISESLELLAIEDSILSAKEIKDIGSVLSITRTIKNFLSPYIKEKTVLKDLYKNLFSSRDTERIINDSIDNSFMIKDSASRDLARIRKNIKELERTIISILENIINRSSLSDIIQERIVTIRKDRFVIPVKQTFSSKIKGIIHDRSSSGQTIYLEPENVVELNNKLSDLKIQEHLEIRKILKFLTSILREKYPLIRAGFDSVIKFDYLYAVYKYASNFKAIFPELDKDLKLEEAKHPIFLMSNKPFNPIDIILKDEKRGLIITGPNTGGKTVALKTAGLLSMIYQTGIPVPVSEGSTIRIFDGVYADIGDMQSIEQDLSTYSSHIKNINEILSYADENSLVLLDELIPGTDPDEGSAIGIGILKKLKEKKSFTIATTHYKQIKIFALSDDYFEIASVGFDKESLSPTYTIHYKSIGESMAFYIAEKLGFPKDILENSTKYLDEYSMKIEEAIKSLEEYKTAYEKEHSQVIELKRQLQKDKEKYEKLVKELEKKKKEKWQSELKKAEEYLKEIKEEGYRIIEEIKTNPSGKNLEKFVKDKKGDIYEIIHSEQEEEVLQDLNIGDKVRLKGKNTVGEIISVRENKVNINFNGIKIWANINQVEKVKEHIKAPKKKKTKFNIKRDRNRIKPEIKLIGMTKEQAIKELSDYLDKAVLEGLRTVRIIHGYGSGVLRKSVREYLDKTPYNIRYEDAPYHEGGMGVTVAHIE